MHKKAAAKRTMSLYCAYGPHGNIQLLQHSEKQISTSELHINQLLCTHFVTEYYHFVCVVLVFKLIPEDDSSRDRNMLNQILYCFHRAFFNNGYSGQPIHLLFLSHPTCIYFICSTWNSSVIHFITFILCEVVWLWYNTHQLQGVQFDFKPLINKCKQSSEIT
jgi:hypothetical protein